MNKRIEEELFPFYALDALTAEEKAEVEAYIASDPAAKTRLDALQETAELLPLATEPAAPSAAVKRDLMARVAADRRTVRQETAVPPKPVVKRPSTVQPSWWDRFRQSFALPALAGTAALAAIILLIWGISLNRQVNDLQSRVTHLSDDTDILLTELETLRGDNEQLQVRNETLQQQLNAQDDILASYQQPGSSTIAIADTTGENPTAVATLTVAPDATSATFVAANLPALTADQVYQLWIIQGDLPMSAGIFEVDENGRVVFPVDGTLAASFDAVGVSIEPAGGSDSPTQDQIILLGVASS